MRKATFAFARAVAHDRHFTRCAMGGGRFNSTVAAPLEETPNYEELTNPADMKPKVCDSYLAFGCP